MPTLRKRIKDALPNTTRAQNIPTTELPTNAGFFVPYTVKKLITTKHGTLGIATVPNKYLAPNEVDPTQYPHTLLRANTNLQPGGVMVQFTQLIGFTFTRRSDVSRGLVWIKTTKDQTSSPRPTPRPSAIQVPTTNK